MSGYMATLTSLLAARCPLGLAGFLVGRVGGAPTAVLLHLHPVAGVVPVLLGDVVAPLALATLKRHVDASITRHQCLSKGRLEKSAKYSDGRQRTRLFSYNPG